MLITLTKLGRNCQVVFYNTDNANTQTFQEDSANIECTYNVLNDVVSVAVKGRTQATTTSIVDNDVLYINTGTGDILIKTYADFLINYALLFLNAGGSGGGTNPTGYIMPVNVGGTFADSNIQNFPDNQIYTLNNVIGNYGLSIDFTTYITKLGDYDNFNANGYINIDNSTGVISTFYGATEIGLKLDNAASTFTLGGDFLSSVSVNINTGGTGYKLFYSAAFGAANGLYCDFNFSNYQFGDINAHHNNLHFTIDSLNNFFQFYSSAGALGMYFNFATSLFTLGDYFQTNNSTYFAVNDSLQRLIYTSSLGQYIGLYCDFANNIYFLGDHQNNINNTYISINDDAQKIFFNTVNGSYNFANIQAYTDNADALANGLIVGDIYRHAAGGLESADQLRIVH